MPRLPLDGGVQPSITVAPLVPRVSAVGPRLSDDDDFETPEAPVSPMAARVSAPKAVAPQIARPTDEGTLEAAATDEDAAFAGSGRAVGGGLSVSFERNPKAQVGGPPRAPRLTEDEAPQPEPQAAPMATIDESLAERTLSEALKLADRGEFAKAIQKFTDAVEMRPGSLDAHIGRGRCHLELGDYSSAMSDFQRAEDVEPNRPDPHVAMGDLYFARKEYKRAIEFFDQAVELDGSHAMARCRRGISHYYRKNYRQAHQDLSRALALDPEIPNIRKYVQMAQKKLDRGE